MLLRGGLGAVSTANDTTIWANFVGLRCSIKRRHEATFFNKPIPSYGTLVGAALADAFAAIRRGHWCVRPETYGFIKKKARSLAVIF